MRRSLAVVVGLLALAGCHHDKHDLSAKFPEEFNLPPAEPRFDNPPESGYRMPPPKKEFRPAAGMGGPGMSGPAAGRGFGP